MEELLRETNRARVRAETMGPTGWYVVCDRLYISPNWYFGLNYEHYLKPNESTLDYAYQMVVLGVGVCNKSCSCLMDWLILSNLKRIITGQFKDKVLLSICSALT